MIKTGKWIPQFRSILNQIDSLKGNQTVIIKDHIDYFIYQDENGEIKYNAEASEFENIIHCLLNKLSYDNTIEKIGIQDFDNSNQKALIVNISSNDNKIEINILGTDKQLERFYQIYEINKKIDGEVNIKRLLRQ